MSDKGEVKIYEINVVAVGRTTPSDFRRTLRIIPKEPFPMTSNGSYASRKDDEAMNGDSEWC